MTRVKKKFVEKFEEAAKNAAEHGYVHFNVYIFSAMSSIYLSNSTNSNYAYNEKIDKMSKYNNYTYINAQYIEDINAFITFFKQLLLY